MIRKQVRLPLSVAFGVVLQGIRIRLGRSVVTMLGVALGVAFLMSILSANMLRRSVSGETALRFENQRMMGFLKVETGSLRDKTVGVWQTGDLSEIEKRVLQSALAEGVEKFLWHRSAGSSVTLARTQSATLPELIDNEMTLIVVGNGQKFATADLTNLTGADRRKLIIYTRKALAATAGAPEGVALERELRPDEVERAEREAAVEKVRTVWIVVISLLVTLIGITNALLMSVTERFREIGTMKCLGALSSFIRQIFFIESALIGLVGGVLGALFGLIFSTLIYMGTYGVSLVVGSLQAGPLMIALVGCIFGGIACSILAAIYPATFASRMVPATALRTNI